MRVSERDAARAADPRLHMESTRFETERQGIPGLRYLSCENESPRAERKEISPAGVNDFAPLRVQPLGYQHPGASYVEAT